jgi:hypothetical protein
MSKRKAARTTKARSASKIPSKSAGSGQPTGQASSKQAWVLALLCGPSGATIATVTRSTGWQPHTVRAFLAAVVQAISDHSPQEVLAPAPIPLDEMQRTYDWLKSWGMLEETASPLDLVNMDVQRYAHQPAE